MKNDYLQIFWCKGSFTNYVDKILAFFDYLLPSDDIFYLMNVDKKWTFFDHLPPSSCKRSLWTTSNTETQNIKKIYVDLNNLT